MSLAFEFFAGPCVLESKELGLLIARTLKEEIKKLPVGDVKYTFKASFDKANRSSMKSYRGPGLQMGLKWLSEIKEELQVPVLTDIHLPEQAYPVSEVADIIQIPAFLCRQTDLIVEAAQACIARGRRLNIKKGQFLSPFEVKHILSKTDEAGLPRSQVLITERGSSFGYQRLVVDMMNFKIINELGVKSVHDATHCVQLPGALENQTGGARDFIQVLGRAAVAAGAKAVFFECHPEPQLAKSDAATALSLDEAKLCLREWFELHQIVRKMS